MRRVDNPRWRAILEERWRDRLQKVTELSLAYTAQAPSGLKDKGAGRLLSQAVAARRRLADTEEALGRLAAGVFGQCEQCRAPISETLLAAAPEIRYCADCVTAVGLSVSGAETGPLASRVPAQPMAAGRP